MNLNPDVLNSIKTRLVRPTHSVAVIQETTGIEPVIQQTYQRHIATESFEGVSDSPSGEDCVRCGRTYPGEVGIDGKLNLSVIEAAAANFWLSNEELKMVRGAAILRNPRDRDMAQDVYSQLGYRSGEPVAAVLNDILQRVWISMQEAIGPNWTQTPSGWCCQGCMQKEEPGQAISGLGAMTAELIGDERQGDEDEQINLGQLSDSLGLKVEPGSHTGSKRPQNLSITTDYDPEWWEREKQRVRSLAKRK